MDGVIAVATLTGVSGGKVVGEITETMAGAPTAGVTIAGTTAGGGIADEPVTAVRGAIAAFAGGTIVPTIIADGTDGTITDGGTTDQTIDAGAGIGRATFAGGETSVTETERGKAHARVNLVRKASKLLIPKVDSWILATALVL